MIIMIIKSFKLYDRKNYIGLLWTDVLGISRCSKKWY